MGIRLALHKSTAGGACLKLLYDGGGHSQGSLDWRLALTKTQKPGVASGISKRKHFFWVKSDGFVCRADHCDPLLLATAFPSCSYSSL